jgi:predicted lipoprotein with Yx(FWY)xxD motif
MTVTVRGTVVRRATVLPVLLAALVALGACGDPVDEGPKLQLSGADTTLQVRPSFYGATLADGAGHTLYQFSSDRAGGPATCADACAQVWRPYIALGEPRAKDGTKNALDDDQIGTVTRADGRQQVSYAGHPLYYFANDAAPGDPVHVDDIRGAGQNQFGGTWAAVSAAGAPVAPPTGSTVVPD